MSGFYDVHSHFLPGVDDGASDLEETRALLQLEYEDGVRTILVTPHFRRGMFETSLTTILERYEQVKEEARKIAPDLEILLGCEFHENTEMVAMLDQKRRPCMGESRCVLTEFSGAAPYAHVLKTCVNLVRGGYRPIIAHAERCRELRNLDALEELIQAGAYIQMNADSILGRDGILRKLFCKKVMQNDLLHFVGSDGHNMKKRKPAMGACSKYIAKTMGQAYMEKLLIENPRKLLVERRK